MGRWDEGPRVGGTVSLPERLAALSRDPELERRVALWDLALALACVEAPEYRERIEALDYAWRRCESQRRILDLADEIGESPQGLPESMPEEEYLTRYWAARRAAGALRLAAQSGELTALSGFDPDRGYTEAERDTVLLGLVELAGECAGDWRPLWEARLRERRARNRADTSDGPARDLLVGVPVRP